MSENYFRNVSLNYDVENVTPNPLSQECMVEFYRSQKHSKRNFGKKDDEYNGEFGFDRFDKEVCPTVFIMGGTNAYEALSNVIPHEETIKGVHRYACPILSIWPPGVEGNSDNNSKSKVTVFIRAKRVLNRSEKGVFNIRFESSNKAIKINGKDKIILENVEINAKDALSFEVECKKAFGQENSEAAHFLYSACYIDAFIEDGFEEDDVLIGRLIVIPNRYIYYTEVKPVIVRIKEKLSNGSYDYYDKENSNNQKDKIEAVLKLLPDFLNKKSFNQALIHVKCPPKPEYLEITEADFLTNMKKVFSYKDKLLNGTKNQKFAFTEEMEIMYMKLCKKDMNELKKYQAKEDSKVNEKLQAYIKTFNENFSYSYPDVLKDAKISDTLKKDPTKTAKEEFEKALKKYNQLIVNLPNDCTLDKTHKLYLFIFTDIEKAATSVEGIQGDTLAFSATGRGTAFIFSDCIKHNDVLPLITHELGHGICLKHPFLKNAKPIDHPMQERADKKYIQSIIDQLQSEINELNGNTVPPAVIPPEEQQYSQICTDLNNQTGQSDTLDIEDTNAKKILDKIDEGVNMENQAKQPTLVNSPEAAVNQNDNNQDDNTEGNDQQGEPVEPPEIKKMDPIFPKVSIPTKMELPVSLKIKFLEDKIAYLEKLKKNAPDALSLTLFCDQSKTLENIMDYRMNDSQSNNSGFEYKNFRYRQWREMQGKYIAEDGKGGVLEKRLIK